MSCGRLGPLALWLQERVIRMSEQDPEQGSLPAETEITVPQTPALSEARQFVAPLTIIIATAGGLAVLLGLAAPLRASPTACAMAAALLLGVMVTGLSSILVRLRARAYHAAQEAAVQLQHRQQEGKSLFSRSTMWQAEEAARALKRLQRVGRTQLPLAVAVSALLVGGISGYCLAWSTAPGGGSRLFVVGVSCLVVAFLAMFASRWLGSQGDAALPEAPAVVTGLRVLQWYGALGGPALLAHAIGFATVDRWLGRVLLGLVVVMAAELLVRGILALLYSPREADQVHAPVGMVVAESLFSGSNPLTRTATVLESRFGVNVRSSYVIGYTTRVLPLVAAGMLAAFWLATSLVCIKVDEAGVLTRCGRLVSNGWYGPGLHLKAPWPIDRLQRVQTERVRRLVLGRASEKEPPYILWSRSHAENEYRLVLGEGRELVSLDAQVFYRVKDPVAFVYHSQNPETLLSSLAYRLVMRETVTSNLAHVLSQARATLSDNLRLRLQEAADEQALGLDIVGVALRGIHPPTEVAQAYQSVVSAQVEQVTLGVAANADRALAIPQAEAGKHQAVAEAKAQAATRLAAARGEAIRFNAEAAAYAADPGLYRRRLWLETMERALTDKKLYVVDRRATSGEEYWVDLRSAAPTTP